MLQGKDRGKRGKVSGVLTIHSGRLSRRIEHIRVVVEGLNTVKRHQRPRQQGQVGQILTKERPVDISNVQLICPKCSQPTRVGHTPAGGALKTRLCKKCGADI